MQIKLVERRKHIFRERQWWELVRGASWVFSSSAITDSRSPWGPAASLPLPSVRRPSINVFFFCLNPVELGCLQTLVLIALISNKKVLQWNSNFIGFFKKSMDRDFPGGPVAKTPHYQRRGPGLIPGQGTRSHMLQLKVCMPRWRLTTSKQINVN